MSSRATDLVQAHILLQVFIVFQFIVNDDVTVVVKSIQYCYSTHSPLMLVEEQLHQLVVPLLRDPVCYQYIFSALAITVQHTYNTVSVTLAYRLIFSWWLFGVARTQN